MAFKRSFAPYSGSWRKAYDKAKALKPVQPAVTCAHCEKLLALCSCVPDKPEAKP